MEALTRPDVLLMVALVVYSIVLHEIAHGYAALRYGDPTALQQGRITLNPISHVDPIGTVLFPLLQVVTVGYVLIGWARPVPVNIYNLRPRVQGEVVVAVAGVAVNFAIAILMAVLLGFQFLVPPDSALERALWLVMFANVALGVFNLLPIPPLDGSHVLKQFLPASARETYEKVGFYGIFILLFLIATGALREVIVPPIMFLVGLLLHITAAIRGIF